MLVTKNSNRWNMAQQARYTPSIGEVIAFQRLCSSNEEEASEVDAQLRWDAELKNRWEADSNPMDHSPPNKNAMEATL